MAYQGAESRYCSKTGCYGHVLQKEDNDWGTKCIEYEAEGSRPQGLGLGMERLCEKTVKH